MLDHVGFGVSDYERSKAFYSEALAPLGIELIKEPVGRAAGFGQDGKPFFWLEATRPAGSTTARPARARSTTSTITAPMPSIRTGTTSRRSAIVQPDTSGYVDGHASRSQALWLRGSEWAPLP